MSVLSDLNSMYFYFLGFMLIILVFLFLLECFIGLLSFQVDEFIRMFYDLCQFNCVWVLFNLSICMGRSMYNGYGILSARMMCTGCLCRSCFVSVLSISMYGWFISNILYF